MQSWTHPVLLHAALLSALRKPLEVAVGIVAQYLGFQDIHSIVSCADSW